MIVDAEVYAAENLNHVDPLGADSEILLHEVGICERAGDTHCDRAESAVRLAAHESDRDSAACEAEDLLLDVGGNRRVVHVLNIVTVNRERGKSALCVRSHDGGEVDRAGALGAVEAPDRLGCQRVKVHRLAAVAPAGCYRKSSADVQTREFLGAESGFLAAADSGVGDYALDVRSVRVEERRLD